MITPEQEKWLSHLDDQNSTDILPYDPSSEEKFQKIKSLIQNTLGDIEIVHRGATSLKISGQGELDVYIPVPPEEFEVLLLPLENLFGRPGSLYGIERARFTTSVENTKVEVFLINQESAGWINGCKFEEYLKRNPKSLREYERLKEESGGLSTQAYYRRKTAFINKILERVENNAK